MGNSSTFASNKASQPNQSTLSRKNQDEGFSSRRCSGCHSLRFRCALEGRQEVLGRPLEGWLEERPRGEVHGQPVGLLHRCALQPRRPRRGSWPAVLEDHFGGNVNGGRWNWILYALVSSSCTIYSRSFQFVSLPM